MAKATKYICNWTFVIVVRNFYLFKSSNYIIFLDWRIFWILSQISWPKGNFAKYPNPSKNQQTFFDICYCIQVKDQFLKFHHGQELTIQKSTNPSTSMDNSPSLCCSGRSLYDMQQVVFRLTPQSIESRILKITTNPCHSADLKDPTLKLSNQLYFEVQTQHM